MVPSKANKPIFGYIGWSGTKCSLSFLNQQTHKWKCWVKKHQLFCYQSPSIQFRTPQEWKHSSFPFSNPGTHKWNPWSKKQNNLPYLDQGTQNRKVSRRFWQLEETSRRLWNAIKSKQLCTEQYKRHSGLGRERTSRLTLIHHHLSTSVLEFDSQTPSSSLITAHHSPELLSSLYSRTAIHQFRLQLRTHCDFEFVKAALPVTNHSQPPTFPKLIANPLQIILHILLFCFQVPIVIF